MRRFGVIVFMVLSMAAQASAAEEHAVLTGLIKDYVKEEGVNYKGLCKDTRLGDYIKQISSTDPEVLSSKESKFAFWLNTYTAYSMKAICDHYPIKSLDQLNFGGLVVAVVLKKTVWDKPFVLIHGKKLTLKAVDHEILRPQFNDKRINFTIACGAVSCAPIAAEAYEADHLETQLDAQAKKFFNDAKLNSFDVKSKTAHLAMPLKFSINEFGSSEVDLLVYAAQFLPEDAAASIKTDPKSWKIQYNTYDLTLNDKEQS